MLLNMSMLAGRDQPRTTAGTSIFRLIHAQQLICSDLDDSSRLGLSDAMPHGIAATRAVACEEDGAWDDATLIMPTSDPLEKEQFGGDLDMMEDVFRARSSLKALKEMQ